MLDLHSQTPPLEVRILGQPVTTTTQPEDLLDELSRQPTPALLDSSARALLEAIDLARSP